MRRKTLKDRIVLFVAPIIAPWVSSKGELIGACAFTCVSGVVWLLSVIGAIALGEQSWLSFWALGSSVGSIVIILTSIIVIISAIFHNDGTKKVGYCENCGYDLRGSKEIGRCPECGAHF